MGITLNTLFYKRTSTSGPEAQLFLIPTLIMTLLKGVGKLIYVNTITNDPATINGNPSIILRDSWNVLPKIEASCSHKTVFIIVKSCIYSPTKSYLKLYVGINLTVYRQDAKRGCACLTYAFIEIDLCLLYVKSFSWVSCLCYIYAARSLFHSYISRLQQQKCCEWWWRWLIQTYWFFVDFVLHVWWSLCSTMSQMWQYKAVSNK